jgi:TolA-binding protein
MDQQQPVNNTPETPKTGDAQNVKQFNDLLREYGQPILIGVTLAVVVFLGLAVYRNFKQSNEQKASQMLFNARSADELQQIATQYSGTKAAPLALLSAASMAFEASQYESAQRIFTQFQQRYPQHELSPSAELGLAQCLEALGQTAAAEEAFKAFTKAHPNHFLTPMATLGLARCYEQAGKFDEAKAVYEDFIAANPDSPWASQAESGLKFLEQSRKTGPVVLPAAAATAMPPVVVTPPAAPESSNPAPAPSAAPAGH